MKIDVKTEAHAMDPICQKIHDEAPTHSLDFLRLYPCPIPFTLEKTFPSYRTKVQIVKLRKAQAKGLMKELAKRAAQNE